MAKRPGLRPPPELHWIHRLREDWSGRQTYLGPPLGIFGNPRKRPGLRPPSYVKIRDISDLVSPYPVHRPPIRTWTKPSVKVIPPLPPPFPRGEWIGGEFYPYVGEAERTLFGRKPYTRPRWSSTPTMSLSHPLFQRPMERRPLIAPLVLPSRLEAIRRQQQPVRSGLGIETGIRHRISPLAYDYYPTGVQAPGPGITPPIMRRRLLRGLTYGYSPETPFLKEETLKRWAHYQSIEQGVSPLEAAVMLESRPFDLSKMHRSIRKSIRTDIGRIKPILTKPVNPISGLAPKRRSGVLSFLDRLLFREPGTQSIFWTGAQKLGSGIWKGRLVTFPLIGGAIGAYYGGKNYYDPNRIFDKGMVGAIGGLGLVGAIRFGPRALTETIKAAGRFTKWAFGRGQSEITEAMGRTLPPGGIGPIGPPLRGVSGFWPALESNLASGMRLDRAAGAAEASARATAFLGSPGGRLTLLGAGGVVVYSLINSNEPIDIPINNPNRPWAMAVTVPNDLSTSGLVQGLHSNRHRG